MTSEERKIYDMVVRRFLSVLYPAFDYEQTTLKQRQQASFSRQWKNSTRAGWKAVYEEDMQEEIQKTEN